MATPVAVDLPKGSPVFGSAADQPTYVGKAHGTVCVLGKDGYVPVGKTPVGETPVVLVRRVEGGLGVIANMPSPDATPCCVVVEKPTYRVKCKFVFKQDGSTHVADGYATVSVDDETHHRVVGLDCPTCVVVE